MNDSSQAGAALTSTDVRHDLKAAIGARAELGPEMEDHVIEVFLGHIEDRIQVRIDQAVTAAKAGLSRKEKRLEPTEMVLPSFALAIPLVAISAAMTGTIGVAAVMACVILVNAMYIVYDLKS